MTDLLPEVLLNALSQYRFNGSPLWRVREGKDHVKIKVTFWKQTNQYFGKKGAEGRRQPTPPAGEWPHQPKDWQLLKDQRPVWRRRHHHHHHRLYQTLQDPPSHMIACIIEPAPIIPSPTTLPSVSPPKKKSRISSPDRGNIEPPKDYNYFAIKDPDWYPLQEKYELQEIGACKFTGFTSFVFKVQRKNQPNEHQRSSARLLHVSSSTPQICLHEEPNVQILQWRMVWCHREEVWKGKKYGLHQYTMAQLSHQCVGWHNREDPPCLPDTSGIQVLIEADLGDDTQQTIGWGHPLGSWVRTPTQHLGEDTHFASFPATRHMVSECNLLTTRVVYLIHYAVGIDMH